MVKTELVESDRLYEKDVRFPQTVTYVLSNFKELERPGCETLNEHPPANEQL